MQKQNCRHFFFILILFVQGLTSNTVKAQKLESYTSKLTGDVVKYIVYYPEGYTVKKKYPLLIFLHGMDEKTWPAGGFNENIRKNGLPLQIEKGLKLPFVVVAPCCGYADWDHIGWSMFQKSKLNAPGALTVEIAKMAKAKYSIDSTRLYLTGLSMGGAGVFSVVENYPHFFQAAIAIAGWGDPANACKVKTPVWAFQGSSDGGDGVKNLIEAIRKCNPGSESKATILQGQGHVIWDLVYQNKASGNTNIYSWLLNYTSRQIKN